MSSRGTFSVDRDIFRHRLFNDSAPFSRLEAWLWLIAEAAYKPRSVRIAGKTYDLERGQLAVSTRYLAEAWRWPQTSVRRFLDTLKAAQERLTSGSKTGSHDGPMIGSQSGSGVTIITIYNYNKYQPEAKRTGSPSGTHDDTQSGSSHFGNTAENRLKSKEQITERKIGGASAPADDLPNFVAPERPAGKSYVFEGNTVRLTKDSFDKWRASYKAIPDLRAELQAADDYYTENPPRDGKWFFPVSRWLAKANADAVERKEQANYGVTWQ
ncbi:hypothetical protein ACWX0K_07030 [Nitrobacteraceae bacterium UC4446_H13]